MKDEGKHTTMIIWNRETVVGSTQKTPQGGHKMKTDDGNLWQYKIKSQIQWVTLIKSNLLVKIHINRDLYV